MGEDFFSLFGGNTNSTANFSPTTNTFDTSQLYSGQQSFADSLTANGGIGLSGSTGTTAASANPFGDFFTNGDGGMGWGSAAIGAGTGLAQTFLGFQQLSEGKKQNAIAQNQWQQQFDIQKEEYDRRVSERAQRVADNQTAKTAIGG